MSNWKYTVNIKQYLSEDDSAEAIRKAARNIHNILTESNIPPEVLRDVAYEIGYIGYSFEQPSLEEFNFLLDNLYDWADSNNVWLG
jgi:hypothetical protein